MKEVIKYEFMLIVNGNARIRVTFSDNTTKVLTVQPQLLASYEAILKQPDVAYDTANDFFISRDRLETRDLRSF